MSTTISSREFNQDASRAKRATRKGPVFITDRGRPAHVLMTVEDYERLAGKSTTIVELLADASAAAVEFEPERVSANSLRSADFA